MFEIIQNQGIDFNLNLLMKRNKIYILRLTLMIADSIKMALFNRIVQTEVLSVTIDFLLIIRSKLFTSK